MTRKVMIVVQVVEEVGDASTLPEERRTTIAEVESGEGFGPFHNLRVSDLNEAALKVVQAIWEAREIVRTGRSP